MAEGEGTIQSRADFKGPDGPQQLWTLEIKAAKKNREDFLKQGDEAVQRYLDERKDTNGPKSRLNLFHANVTTLRALLYGKTPKVDVSRRFNDSQDDDARVGAEMMDRILNTDIESDDDGFTSALRYALEDWILVGLGQMWLRYETGEEEVTPAQPARMGPCPHCGGTGQMQGPMGNMPCAECGGTGQVELASEVPETTRRPDEDCDVDYIHWRDFLWSPCRTWHEVRWVAKRLEMTKDAARKRWPQAEKLPLTCRLPEGEDRVAEKVKDAWSRVEVWEIWDKETKTQLFFVEGYTGILETNPDPLELENFFPCPRPLITNATTGKFMPKPDLFLAKDLYDEIDTITHRIKRLEHCAKVRWAYDGGVPDLRRIFEDAFEGQGIPVKNWNQLMEGGGIAGAMQFAPLDVIVKALEILSARRAEKIQLMYQITGMSDIVRGQAAQRATATEQSIKAQFASTRVQTAQDELARIASDAQRIRAEIISKWFSPETIVERSNVMQTPGAQRAQAAVELIKGNMWQYRITVRPESIALPDMATQRQERSEAVQALGTYFQSMMPLVQMAGSAGPQGIGTVMEFVIATGQWMLSGLRGAAEVEEAFDKFAAKAAQLASQPPPPPQPNPRLQVEQIKAQAETGRAQADMQQTAMDSQAAQAEHLMRMREMAMKANADRMKVQGQVAVAAAQPPTLPGGPNA